TAAVILNERCAGASRTRSKVPPVNFKIGGFSCFNWICVSDRLRGFHRVVSNHVELLRNGTQSIVHAREILRDPAHRYDCCRRRYFELIVKLRWAYLGTETGCGTGKTAASRSQVGI